MLKQFLMNKNIEQVNSFIDLNKLIDDNQIERNENIGIENHEEGTIRSIHLQLIIRDTGIGIKESDLPNLFVDFGKLNDKNGRNKSGTGLGLSICKQIIEQMGGSVEVKSEEGVGSDFIINMKTKCRIVKT